MKVKGGGGGEEVARALIVVNFFGHLLIVAKEVDEAEG